MVYCSAMSKTEIDIEELRGIYENEGIRAVTERFGCSRPTAYALLDKAGIPRKSPGVANRFVLKDNSDA